MVRRGTTGIELGEASTEEAERAGHPLQDVAEVLGTHHRVRLGVHEVVAEQLGGRLHHLAGVAVIVDGDRVAERHLDLHASVVGGGDALGDAPQFVVHLRARALRHRADRPEDRGRLGDHVARRAGGDLGDRDDRWIEHVDATRHHRLDRLHDRAGDRNRIERLVRRRRVSATAGDDDVQRVGRRHRGTAAQTHDAAARHRRDVQREGTGDRAAGVGRRVVEQPFFEHEAGAVEPFLAGLEHEEHPTGEISTAIAQQAGRAGEHRHVGVVPAGVHRPVDRALVRQPRVLRHRQRVHVAAQQHRRPRLRPFEHGHDARHLLAGAHRERQRRQGLEDPVARVRELQADLGPGMQRAAQAHRLG